MLADSTPGVVLFDTGATNSFISCLFADKLNLKPTTRINLNVKTATGLVVACKDIYGNVSIEIAGVNCPANLIRFELEGLDVVLGMDWLDKYKAQIICNERKVVIRGLKGKRVSYRGIEKEPEPKLMTMRRLRKYAQKGYWRSVGSQWCVNFRMCSPMILQECLLKEKWNSPMT
ncbi:retroviral-like aspartic protease family protein [Escherichia coli]|uniref:retroviral-like aspartic protease family protein n=1 Tax=Escherichia coli TaxID=562 RepID=UPI003D815E3F